MGRIRYCSVATCIHNKGTNDSNVQFFMGRPRSVEWKTAIEKAPCSIARNGRLCILHFADEDIIKQSDRARLKSDAVPTIFLGGTTQINGHEVDTPRTSENNTATAITENGIKLRKVARVVKSTVSNFPDVLDEEMSIIPEIKIETHSTDPLHEFRLNADNTTYTHTADMEITDDVRPATKVTCVNCIHQDVKMQSLTLHLKNMSERLRHKQFQVKQLQTRIKVLEGYKQLKSKVPLRKCFVCSRNIRTTQIMAHICREELKSIPCEYCSMELDSTIGLQQHLNIFHKDEKEVKRCDICAMDFDMSLLYDFHMEILHVNDAVVDPQQEIKVEQVEETIVLETPKRQSDTVELVKKKKKEPQSNADFIEAQITTKNPMNYYQCGICNEMCENASSLGAHMKTNHSMGTFECHLCKKRMRSRQLLTYHFKIAHTYKQMQCNVCNIKLLSIDMSSHSCIESQHLICELCSAPCTSLNSFKKHLSNHVERRLYKCNVCRREFTAQVLLEHHKNVHKDKTFSCEVCKKLYATKYALDNHSKLSHPNQVILCELCGKPSKCMEGLKIHMQTHEPPKFKCPKCPKVLVTISALKYHSEVHKEKESHQCHLCSKIFDFKRLLVIHLKRHKLTEADKKFPCHLCSFKGEKRHKLDFHIRRVHFTDTRTHACTYCDKKYKYAGDLNKHLRSHLGEKMYKCPECPAAFRMPFELNRHSYTHMEYQTIEDNAGEGSTVNVDE